MKISPPRFIYTAFGALNSLSLAMMVSSFFCPGRVPFTWECNDLFQGKAKGRRGTVRVTLSDLVSAVIKNSVQYLRCHILGWHVLNPIRENSDSGVD